MGNVALCAPSMASTNSVVKVLTHDGKLIIYSRRPVIAAEIMLQNPGQFLCESHHFKVGQRILGMCAEEELEGGELYFLLPMEMLYSVLTVEEMKFLGCKASKNFKQAALTLNLSKIFPEFCLFPSSLEGKRVEDIRTRVCSKVTEDGYSRQRSYSWQPALETILETSTYV
ncbi:hypothetical protein F511_10609 [Dorcoceras hygrometricum]|uniref:Uncharacterized protein n=1 Tax=Dorcoceras hygrometricum TaxID=472368 RepID=A0A2Z7CPF4_9LAMI|nr:hypothetical protein F511_10609 [Dorcoceras hygrometricum]